MDGFLESLCDVTHAWPSYRYCAPVFTHDLIDRKTTASSRTCFFLGHMFVGLHPLVPHPPTTPIDPRGSEMLRGSEAADAAQIDGLLPPSSCAVQQMAGGLGSPDIHHCLAVRCSRSGAPTSRPAQPRTGLLPPLRGAPALMTARNEVQLCIRRCVLL